MEDTCIFQKKIVILQLNLCAQARYARVCSPRKRFFIGISNNQLHKFTN